MAEEHRITRQDVNELAGRLEEWAKTLPDQDQLVLGWVIARAAAADLAGDEVSGYDMGMMGAPFSSQLQQSVGFGGPMGGPGGVAGPAGMAKGGGNSISVQWSHSFGGR